MYSLPFFNQRIVNSRIVNLTMVYCFVIDVSDSMNDRLDDGMTIFDISKCAVEQFIATFKAIGVQQFQNTLLLFKTGN